MEKKSNWKSKIMERFAKLGLTLVLTLLPSLGFSQQQPTTPAGAMVKRKDPMEYEHKLRFFAQTTNPGDLGLAFADMASRA